MQFASYQAFRTAVEKLIEGDDIGGTFSVNTLDLIIGLAEQRVYRDLRSTAMLADLSVVLASNEAALPADLLELKEVYFDGEPPLEIIPLERLRKLEDADTSTGMATRYCAQDGDTLRFWPTASGTLLGRYYKRPADLESVTWADADTFARHPDVFIFASLVEAMPFLGMESKAAGWNVRYEMAIEAAHRDEAKRVYGGSALRMRAG
jgi:hypothetical protein